MDITTFFTQAEAAILLKLIIAHILADFTLQSNSSILSKSKKGLYSGRFWLHIVLVLLLSSAAMLGSFNWTALLIITLSHLLIDLLKVRIENQFDAKKKEHLKKYSYIADQLLHLTFMLIAWLMIIGGWNKFFSLLSQLYGDYTFLLLATGYLIVIGPATYLIKYLTIQWTREIANPDNSLNDAGKTIGILERIIVLTLVYTQQYAAIGFLITAKSILRLIDKPEYPAGTRVEEKIFSTRKHTEYVLIGTFLSLSIAIFTGLVILQLL